MYGVGRLSETAKDTSELCQYCHGLAGNVTGTTRKASSMDYYYGEVRPPTYVCDKMKLGSITYSAPNHQDR